MQVRCPECLEAIELSSDSTLHKIDCPTCGSNFDLVGDETVIGEGRTNSVSENGVSAIGHFTLIKEVGQGAFGTVWLARDQELDRDVAIKVPRRGQLNGEEAERFFREARASAQLQHPNIVTVHEVGRDGDIIFVVSDFVIGVTLSDWLEGQQPTARESAQLCIKIADALHHAHEMGIVHRDLKPGNIMMDRDGEPHIMDFGLAKRDTSEATLTLDGQILGTPAYMSPEQAKGEGGTADRRADVYSTGVVLFELLTGEVPFRGNVRMLIHQIINEEPPSPRKLNSKIPKDLETICLRCIQKSPSRRYQAAADIAGDLGHWLNHEPITAKAIGPIERSWLWCRRNVAVSLLAFLGVSLLIGIAGVTTAAYLREVGFRKSVQNALGRESDALGKARLAQTAAEASKKSAVAARDDAVVARNDAVEQERLTQLQLYVSDMYRAPQVWESGSIGMLRGLLDRHIPGTGEPDNRGFEWHFWHQRSNDQVWNVDLELMMRDISNPDSKSNAKKSLIEVARIQRRLVFLNDGREVAKSGGFDAILHVLDSQTGQFTRTIPYPATASSERRSAKARISSVSYTGGRILVALVFADGEVELCDVQSGKLQTSIKGIPLPVTATDFSDDGKLLAVCSKDGAVQVRDVTNGKQVSSFRIAPHKHGDNQSTYPWRVEFSPTGRLIAVGSRGGSRRRGKPIVIHDVASGEQQVQVNTPYNSSSGVFTNREDRLITVGNDERVMLWDLNGPKLIRSMEGHGATPTAISLSPDRKRVATGASDRIIHVWDSETLERLATLRGHESNVRSVEFSQDGQQLYSRSNSELVKWDLSRESTASVVSTGNLPLRDLQASPDGRRLAICTQSTADIRALNDNGLDVKFNQGTPLDAGAFSEDGVLFVSSGPRHLRIWKDAASKPRVIADIPHRARSIAISPNKKWVVAGGGFAYNENKEAYLVFIDLELDKSWKLPIKDGAIMKVQFVGPHEFLTASYGTHGSLSKWNLENRKIEETASFPGALALDVALAHRVAAVVEHGGAVRLYRIDSLELIGTLPATGPGVIDLAFLPDGHTLAVADLSNDVKLWNLQSRQLVGALSGHKDRVTKLTTVKNPPRLFSGSRDGEVRVWHGGP